MCESECGNQVTEQTRKGGWDECWVRWTYTNNEVRSQRFVRGSLQIWLWSLTKEATFFFEKTKWNHSMLKINHKSIIGWSQLFLTCSDWTRWPPEESLVKYKPSFCTTSLQPMGWLRSFLIAFLLGTRDGCLCQVLWKHFCAVRYITQNNKYDFARCGWYLELREQDLLWQGVGKAARVAAGSHVERLACP